MPAPCHWFDAHDPLRPRLPAGLRAWLLDSGSLTAHLQRRGNFRVQVLHHGPAQISRDERDLLGLHARQCAIVREVLLCVNDEPRVYARSVLPHATLQGRHRYLRRFGARSLGAHLFGNRRAKRDPFQLCHWPGGALPAPAGLAGDAPSLWARRSRFWLDGRPLLVAEVFLPAFRPWTESAA